ncbi:MarR family winged helix-turn-helix transcriptional regulator [Rothia kristinae]|uniref:MarR family winged helix-turn-helix transcriptional regulator n=1 Tax=Rothia kristinae TaxID=37923 RepID=UPI0022E1E839|nr:MarR family transcriptional regulator [Rothia kristinae]
MQDAEKSWDETPEGMDRDQYRAGELIVRASRFVRAASRHRGRERSAVVLRTLSNLIAQGPLRIGDLAHAEHITQPTMTGVIQRLEAQDLVTRVEDPEDGRARLVLITEAGRREMQHFREMAAERVRPAVEQLSERERETLWEATKILRRMTRELDSDAG